MYKKISLTKSIFIAIVLGVLAGLALQNMPNGFVRDDLLLGGIIRLSGQGFIRLIQMLVVPLVFTSLVVGSSSLGDIKSIGRMGSKTIVFFLVTSFIGVLLSVVIASFINPGAGLDLSHLISSEPTINEATPLVETLINMIPTNPINAMANGDMLPIIIFAFLVGTAIATTKEKTGQVHSFFVQLDLIFNKMVLMVMNFAPIGVFALITTTFAAMGIDVFLPLLMFIFTVIFILVIHAIVVYGGLLKVARISVIKFLKIFAPAAALAFSTSSSNATLPVTIESMKKAGVDNKVSSFVLPLGATINMDGTAIYQGVAVIFIAAIYGIELSVPILLTVILTATLASVGTAGVPGAGLITLSMVLASAGLPIEGIGLIMGIDRILGMSRTTLNIMGDCVGAILIAKSEGLLDEEMLNEPTATPVTNIVYNN